MGVTQYFNEISDMLGFYPIIIKMDLLDAMSDFSDAILFLGLIFNIIIALFTCISCLLIYSLLMISVETKTFETGVMRMIGLNKNSFITMILVQAFMFVLPSIVAGFALSIRSLTNIYDLIFTEELGVTAVPFPNNKAIILATSVAILIPCVSSIAPI